MQKFVVTPADLESMEQIARVSSREPVLGKQSRWTELAIYHRAGWTRPFVAVVEGHSNRPGETLRFQYAAVGTLERAVNWFEGSQLRDELAAMIPTDWVPRDLAPFRTAPGVAAKFIGASDIVTAAASHGPITAIPISTPGNATSSAALENVAIGYRGKPSLTDALAWLYGSEFGSDRALALAFEQDFGVAERTTRNTLAIEDGRSDGKVGPWLQPFLAALRFFDRQAWKAGKNNG